ncbi:MAG: hypothetical protein L0Z62_34650 [Gemmataceae bacterium]|nr:hypothetical protein [Gemmataceae bacterium]
MHSFPVESPPVKPSRARAPRPLAPASGTVRLLRPVGTVNDTTGEIRIDAKDYYLQVEEASYRLVGYDQQHQAPTAYDLPLDLSTCDCADATYRSERPGGCKHRRALEALRAAGKLPLPVPEVTALDNDAWGQQFEDEPTAA